MKAEKGRCWFGRYRAMIEKDPSLWCSRPGTYGWTKEAADKAGATPNSVMRLARWCKEHAHPDDCLLNEDGSENKGLGTSQQKERESQRKTRQDGDMSR